MDISTDVVASAKNDAWILVKVRRENELEAESHVLHWNGKVLEEPTPSVRGGGYGFWVNGPNDIWIGGEPARHFDGVHWLPFEQISSVSVIHGDGKRGIWLADEGAAGAGARVRQWDGRALATALEISPKIRAFASTPKRDYLFAVGEGGATLRLATPAPPVSPR